MIEEKISSVDLDVHPTTSVASGHENGSLTVVWRDWDKIIQNFPKMVYVSTVNRGELKGPHIHKKRNSYLICIHGKVLFVIKDKDGKYIEIESNSEKPKLVVVPKNVASAHYNLNDEISRVLVLADVAWHPNDDEMKNVEFENYDWKKWKK